MKIITWNINGYRSITGQNPSTRYGVKTTENKLFDYIAIENPDIICLQETKASVEQIDQKLICPQGYFAYYNSCKTKKGYSGVAVFTKQEPKQISFGLGNPLFDDEGRIQELTFDSFALLNIYFPKGYTDHERLNYKLHFYDYILDYVRKNKNKNFIISGDYNTAHKEIDLARPKDNINTSGFIPIEREKLDILVDMGFADAFRLINDAPGYYTWWSQRGRARENNVGWRIDYHFLNTTLTKSIINAYHQPNQMGSDHCPVVLEIEL